MKQLDRLQDNIISVIPVGQMFVIIDGNEKKIVTEKQLPLTPAYALMDCRRFGQKSHSTDRPTDSRFKGQTTSHAIVDVGTFPSRSLTAVDVYAHFVTVSTIEDMNASVC